MQNMFSFAFTTFLNKPFQIQTFTTTLSFIFLFLKKITKSKIVKTWNKTTSFHIVLSIF
jgi:hypothetical protein